MSNFLKAVMANLYWVFVKTWSSFGILQNYGGGRGENGFINFAIKTQSQGWNLLPSLQDFEFQFFLAHPGGHSSIFQECF